MGKAAINRNTQQRSMQCSHQAYVCMYPDTLCAQRQLYRQQGHMRGVNMTWLYGYWSIVDSRKFVLYSRAPADASHHEGLGLVTLSMHHQIPEALSGNVSARCTCQDRGRKGKPRCPQLVLVRPLQRLLA